MDDVILHYLAGAGKVLWTIFFGKVNQWDIAVCGVSRCVGVAR